MRTGCQRMLFHINVRICGAQLMCAQRGQGPEHSDFNWIMSVSSHRIKVMDSGDSYAGVPGEVQQCARLRSRLCNCGGCAEGGADALETSPRKGRGRLIFGPCRPT